MQTTSTISPLYSFFEAFPMACADASAEELRYKFENIGQARYYEQRAICLIFEHWLAVTAHVEEWTSRGIVREVALVIRPVREEEDVLEEVPDTEGLDGGWWNGMEERE